MGQIKMKSYSEYQGDKRTCLNCIFIEYDNGDPDVGMPGYIFCEKDEEGFLDIQDEAGEIASKCPFWKSQDEFQSLIDESENSNDYFSPTPVVFIKLDESENLKPNTDVYFPSTPNDKQNELYRKTIDKCDGKMMKCELRMTTERKKIKNVRRIKSLGV